MREKFGEFGKFCYVNHQTLFAKKFAIQLATIVDIFTVLLNFISLN